MGPQPPQPLPKIFYPTKLAQNAPDFFTFSTSNLWKFVPQKLKQNFYLLAGFKNFVASELWHWLRSGPPAPILDPPEPDSRWINIVTCWSEAPTLPNYNPNSPSCSEEKNVSGLTGVRTIVTLERPFQRPGLSCGRERARRRPGTNRLKPRQELQQCCS